MRERHIGWPTYLALLIGIVLACEWVFALVGLSAFDLAGAAIFAVFMIIFDFLSGDTPSQDGPESEQNG